MRNGNQIVVSYPRTAGVSSYRTYEEWKLFAVKLVTAFLIGSYRTYEEWKHHAVPNVFGTRFSSYRTYEEWKQLFDC